MAQVKEIMKARTGGKTPLAYVRTYGCQQNVADGEKIKGLLAEMGFSFTDGPEDADFILFNTCAVRENAEDRVLGNVGALKPLKKQRPEMLIGLCGCMMQQEQMAERTDVPYFSADEGGFATVDENTAFYIDENGTVVVVLPKYAVAPGAYGPQEFPID